MSLMIKGMDMPRHMTMKDYTLRVRQDGTAEMIDRAIGKSYDVIDVPTPHGDLIDRETLKDACESLIEEPLSVALAYTNQYIDVATTIIEAEVK